MAKTIKKITCPQCGSNEVVETKKDYYQCKSCHTQFFLDNDDITINHNNTLAPYTRSNTSSWNYFFIIVIVLIVLFGLSKMFSTDSKPNPSVPPKSHQIEKVVEETKPNTKIKVNLSEGKMIPIKEGKVVAIKYGIVNKNNISKLLVVVVDVLTQEIISQKYADFDLSLMANQSKSKSFDFIKTTNDNDVFLLINEKYLLYFNSSTLSLDYLDDVFFAKHAELSSGIYAITYNSFVEKFTIKNNKGKEYAYFPRIDKIYPVDKGYLIHMAKLPQGKLVTAYDFSEVTDDFPDEEPQLIKYTYMYQPGYTQDFFKIGWVKDYVRYGFIDDSTPYKKVLVLAYPKERARIKSIYNFTPKRTYVRGRVLGHDNEGVMILIKHTIQPEETYTLQKLSAINGEILWSKKMGWNSVNDTFQLNDLYFIASSKTDYLILDSKGEEVTTYNDKDIHVELDIEK